MEKLRDKKGRFIKIQNPKKFRMRLTKEEREEIEEKRKSDEK